VTVRRLLVAAIISICLVAASAGAASEPVGPVLDPTRLTGLPREGLAAQVGSSVVLATARGRVLGHLERFRVLRPSALEQLAPGPRPLALVDRVGDSWELRGGRLVEWRDPLPLVGGEKVVRAGRRWTFRGFRLSFVSERRDLVTVVAERTARVFDLRSGRSAAIPAGCRAAAREGARWFLLCGYPFGDPKVVSTVQVREPDGSLRRLFRPAVTAGRSPAGWWTAAFLSPDRSRLLLQWSGECEIPVAFLARTSGGTPRPVTGETSLRDSPPDSIALGWSGGRAVIDLPRLECGTSKGKPGVYLVDSASRKRSYAYRSSLFWRSVR